MKILLTDRGVSIIPAAIPILVVAIYMRDPLLGIPLAAILSLYIADLSSLLIKNRERCSYKLSAAEPGEGSEGSLFVWERREISLRISGCSSIASIKTPDWLEVLDLRRLGGEEYEARLRTSFRSSGLYRAKEIYLERRGPLGLFMLYQALEISISYRVLPETAYWILYGLKILGIGSQTLPSPGSLGDIWASLLKASVRRSYSGEYLSSREYAPGDPPKRIDWKATGRRVRLIVMEFGESSGGGLSLAIDYRCSGPYTCDSIASSALSLAIFLAEKGIPADPVYEVDSRRVLSFRSPAGLLAYIIECVLERRLIDPESILHYEFSPPLDMGSVRELLRRISEADQKPLDLGGDGDALEILTGPRSRGRDVVLVSMVFHNADWAIDLASSAVAAGSRISIVAPSKPWIDSRDLEEAYRIHSTLDLAVRRLRTMGANIILWGREHGENSG